MKKDKKLLTLREYAKKCNTTHQTVSAAIQSGKISEGYDAVSGKINPDVADMEWGISFIEKKLIKELGAESKSVIEADKNWNPFEMDADIKHSTPLKELIRLELLYKARMAKLKLEEAVHKLVNKDEMYREMFEYGKEVRTQLQSIPDRIIDQLIAMERNEAYTLLLESINQTLDKLTEDESSN